MSKTDDFLPTFTDDVDEFDFGQIPPEPRPDNECSFACEVRRLKRDLRDKNSTIKKLREENNKLHAKCNRYSEQIGRYRRGTPAPVPTGSIPQHAYPQPRMTYPSVPGQMPVGYTTPAGAVVYNDMPFHGVRFQ